MPGSEWPRSCGPVRHLGNLSTDLSGAVRYRAGPKIPAASLAVSRSADNLTVWLAALAEAGIESIRLGTKEMAFYPKRFDDTFLAMMDRFHQAYPDVSAFG